MALPVASIHGNRPAYLDKLFHEMEGSPLPSPTIRSGPRSTKSSISSLNSNFQDHESTAKPLLPNFDTESIIDDRISVRSLRLHLSPRFKIRNLVSRRTPAEIQETVEFECSRPPSAHSISPSKQSFPPRPQTAMSLSPRKRDRSKSKPLPAAPAMKMQQLHCTPCYYFAARNCNGYVFGGSHGDACENCAVRTSTVIMMSLY